MSYLPEQISIRKKQLTQQEFRGYNHNVFLDNRELFDMQNMSSRHYPYAAPRLPRATYKHENDFFGEDITDITDKQGLCFIRHNTTQNNSWFWYKTTDGKYRQLFDVNKDYDGNRKFVSNGAYLVIFPDKKWFNSFYYDNFDKDDAWWAARGMTKPAEWHGSLEANQEINIVRLSMCNVFGDDFDIDYTQPEMPDTEVNGTTWLDISSYPARLMQYSSTYYGWVEVTSTFIKVTFSGAMNGFVDYDGVTITGFPKELDEFNGSKVLYTVHSQGTGETSSYVVIAGLIDTTKDYGEDVIYDLKTNSLIYITKSATQTNFVIRKAWYQLTITPTKRVVQKDSGEIVVKADGTVTVVVKKGERYGSFDTKVAEYILNTTKVDDTVTKLTEKLATIPETTVGTPDIHGVVTVYMHCSPYIEMGTNKWLAKVSYTYYDAELFVTNTNAKYRIVELNGENLPDVTTVDTSATYLVETSTETTTTKTFAHWKYQSGAWSVVDNIVLNKLPTITQYISKKRITSLVVDGTFTTSDVNINISRKVPDMEYVCELDGRIWGCSNENHEIYASQTGFPFNFNVFLGLASDSYAQTIGSDGDFTACISYMGYVLFFKENIMHKIYGTKPSNYQLTSHALRGVEKGSDKSLAILNETLFYKSKVGIMAFNGSAPECISDELGEIRYGTAVAAACGYKYYVSMRRGNTYDLLAYDIQFGMWHKEDNTQFKDAYSTLNEMYYIDGNNHLCSILGSGEDIKIAVTSGQPATETVTTYSLSPEDAFMWSMETGDLYNGSIDNKYIGRLRALLKIFKDTTINVYLQYDNDDEWKHIATKVYKYTGSTKNTFNLPIKPKRSRRMRIKLTGTGDCDIQALAMDIEQGSEI